MEKIKLTGLQEDDYIHPDEVKMRFSAQVSMIQAGLDKLNDISVALMRRILLGRDDAN